MGFFQLNYWVYFWEMNFPKARFDCELALG